MQTIGFKAPGCRRLSTVMILGLVLFGAIFPLTEPQASDDVPSFLKGITFTPSPPVGSAAAAIGVIETVVGRVAVVNRQTQHGHWAGEGDLLFEQDVVATLNEGRCRLTLSGRNVIALGSETVMVIADHMADLQQSRKRSHIEILKGKALFFVYRLFGYKEIDFEVTTPKMVAAVRGTKFGVTVDIKDHALARVVDALALTPDWQARLSVDASHDALVKGLTEITHCEEGRVVVNDQMVAAGTMFDRSINQVGPLSAVYLRGFNAATSTQRTHGAANDNEPASLLSAESAEISDGQSIGETAKIEGQTNSLPDSGENTSETDTSDPGDSSGDIPSGDNTSLDSQPDPVGDISSGGDAGGFDPQPDPGGDPITEFDDSVGDPIEVVTDPVHSPEPDPVPDPEPDPQPVSAVQGYFGAMISEDGLSYLDTVVTKSPVAFDGNDYQATGLSNDTVTMRLDGSQDHLRPYMTAINTTIGSTGDLGTSVPITFHQLGSYDHLQWGYWIMPDSVDLGSDDAEVDNPAYYIFGDPTPEATLQGMSGSVAYAGGASGTYHTLVDGYNMLGTFHCNVNFDSGAVSDFNLSVSSALKDVVISGAGGTLNGGDFTLTGGQWTIEGKTPDAAYAGGSLYGPQAEHMGGVWSMEEGGDAATGVFHGNKQ